MFRLVYSNRTEELIAELAGRVRADQAAAGPLVPVPILVPSGGVEAYVRLGVARACGIAANLAVSLLTRFAGDLLGTVGDAAAFEAGVLRTLLDDEALADDDLAPVRAYLGAAGDAPEAVDVRRVQLAARVGRLFEEYSYSRGEMLAAWRTRATLDGDHAETERWQRRLWNAIMARSGAPTPLCEAVAAFQPSAATLPRAMHVFGFAHVARAFHQLFERLACATDVVVYALSPCAGFWEDVDTADPAPLHLWGRPGREHVRALNAIAAFDHEDRFVEPGEATLLRRLQSDILHREPPRPPRDADDTVVVLEHASVRRELEAVASEIWRLVEADASLRLDDVAVLLPDADAAAYAAHLSGVFHEAYDLPHQIRAVPIGGESRVLEAVDLLLALPLGRFTRQDLLRLAVHPAVVASLDDVDPQLWLAWCDALGIVHGADRDDHEGTYIARDILNWDQGLRRLALGALMAGDASGERRPFALGQEAYVPHEVAASELRDAASFGVLLRSLVADARFARESELTMREWGAWFRTLVETYVAPAGDAEEELLARCLRRVHALGEIDLGGRRVRYRVACELARARIAAMPGGRGGEGVVVSTLGAARPLPYRVVFALGMGEGRFPSPEAEDPLDLRWAGSRVQGDVTARDRDKYAFLELLLGARDRLYVSYVSRDPLTGDALSPSSVVQELLHALARGYVRDPAALRRRHPLRRWHVRYYPDLFGGEPSALGTMRLPEAHAEARVLALRRSAERHGARPAREEIEARAWSDPAWTALAEQLGLARMPERAALADARVVVPMHALVKFLEFPLQGWARFRVGLDEIDDDDPLARDSEPFETDYREETLLLRDILLDAKDRPIEEAYDAAVRDRELRGMGPSGVFAKGERAEHLSTLETWRDELVTADVRPEWLEVHRFGRAGEHARADAVHDPLVIDVDVTDDAGVQRLVRAEIAGRTLPLGADGTTSVTLAKRAKERRDDEWARAGRERAALRAFIDHAVLSASRVAEARPHASVIVVATPDGPVTERVLFAPMTRDEAIVWLRGVVRELLGGPHAYFLPCEAVFVHAARGAGEPVTAVLEEARAKLGDAERPLALRSAYGPVPRPAAYPAPDEGAAQTMIARRFGAFFALRGKERP
jgi:exodeoxyribonuclease V gamma subunit